MESESDPTNQQPPPAILVVTCSSPTIGHLKPDEADEMTEVAGADVEQEIGRCLQDQGEGPVALHRQRSLPPFPTAKASSDIEMQPIASSNPELSPQHEPQPQTQPQTQTQPQPQRFSLMRQRLRFCIRETPAMSRGDHVRFLKRFRLGDTYKLKTRNWLIPQFLSGALTLMGVVLTLVGIISLQINKYLHACDADDGIDCKSNTAKINNVMMPIGVGTTGGGLSLILISGFVFVHAFCVIYEDADNEEDGIHDGVLHIPTSARAALLGSTTVLSPEDIARCQSYYDNLQGYAAN